MKKKIFIGLCVLAAGFTAVACTDTNRDAEKKQAGRAAGEEQANVSTAFTRLSNVQPVPVFDWSQVRQTVIDVATAQANGAVSTTAFYLEGIGMIGWCPSIGSPVASTTQLSATQQWVDLPGHGESLFQVDQGEPTGVYPGQSTGTWTICLDDEGTKFAHYWEGYVGSSFGVMTHDPALRLRPTDVTFTFNSKG